ncbi:MAG TPA: hypothetical protein VLF19_04230, partial [Methylomirabilota bacterium]|nr:hypothetical protein [Methylomirabilota bacterium]
GNVMWNCGEAIQVVSDAVIQNNIILTSDVGITAAPHAQVNGVRNVTIVNNTLYGHDVCLSIGWSGATNAILANNAVYCPSATAVSASLGSAVVRSNYITGSGASIDNVRFFAGGSATAAFANPAGRDLWPTASSVLRNTADASFVPPRDFNETTRTASFDVGAYETEGLASNPGWRVVAGFKTVGSSPPPPPAQALTLIGAVLPSSRSVAVGQTATAFAAVINVGPDRGLTCGLQLATPIAGAFAYQTTNPQTNALIGTANTPVDIEAGSLQTFVFAVTPSAPLAPADVALSMDCANGAPAEVQPGLNTLLLSASTTPVPDVVAMAMTLSGDGIVTATGAGADGVFSVATANVGLGATVTVTADTGSAAVPVSVQLCRTQPATGACLGAPAASVQTMLEAQGTATFGVFVRALGPIAFQPAVHRIHVRFRDGAGVIRGSTSVAVRTP